MDYERTKQKSIGNNKKVAYVKIPKEKYKNILKGTFLAGAITAGLTIGSIHLGYSAINEFNDTKVVYETIMTGRNIVQENTKRTSDNKHYYYDEMAIAKQIAEDVDNLDLNLYSVYKSIGYNAENKIEEMNVILSRLSLYVKDNEKIEVDDFNAYLVNEGFKTPEGQADYKQYDKAMKETIINKHKIDELQNEQESLKKR